MWEKDKYKFKELSEECGSPYAAVNLVSKMARNKLEETNYQILDSKAISWAITGEQPDLHTNKQVISADSISDLDDALANIEDKSVAQSVLDSYNASLEATHLIYCYLPELDECRRARVRIITRMIWEYNK